MLTGINLRFALCWTSCQYHLCSCIASALMKCLVLIRFLLRLSLSLPFQVYSLFSLNSKQTKLLCNFVWSQWLIFDMSAHIFTAFINLIVRVFIVSQCLWQMRTIISKISNFDIFKALSNFNDKFEKYETFISNH